MTRHHVPFAALDRQHRLLRPELDAAFARVVGASSFVLGTEVEAFEREFAEYCGVADCVGVGSGTAALTIALQAAGIGPGDEVVVPAHTFAASALAIVHAGATPVLCDVEEGTGLMDPAAAAAAVSERTAALMPVHLYGQTARMGEIRALGRRYGLLVLEDAAQAHGARQDGRRAGAHGDAAAFSFYPSKNLGALGDGGAICTSDAALAARARQLRDLGRGASGDHLLPGGNHRLDGLQAAFLRAKLPHLDEWNARRREHAETYGRLLRSCLRMTQTPVEESVHHLLPVRTGDRDALARHLAERGIETGVHYPRALHQQPAVAGALGESGAAPDGAFPEAEAWAREELSLPLAAELTDEEIAFVARACADYAHAPSTRMAGAEA